MSALGSTTGSFLSLLNKIIARMARRKNRKNNTVTSSGNEVEGAEQTEQEQPFQAEPAEQQEQESTELQETQEGHYQAVELGTDSSTPLLIDAPVSAAPISSREDAFGKWPKSPFLPNFPPAAPKGSFQDRTSQDAAQSPHSMPFGLKEEEWVDSVAPLTDDPHTPAFTMRVIILGLLW